MLIGAHESVAGGLHLAIDRAEKDSCDAVQIFSKNSSTWREPTLSDEKIGAFRAARARFGTRAVLAHTSYLINLATDKDEIVARSKAALSSEVLRASSLGIDFCVLHPGAHLGAGTEEGCARVAANLRDVLQQTKDASCMILLENTAGQGTCVGHQFSELASILEQVEWSPRVGVCFDTQHAFAAGYDMTTDDGYASVIGELDSTVGLARLRAFHLNDSKKPRGSRVDRHEHIGEGLIGLSVFSRLLADPRFANHPGVLETEPREGDFPYRDEINLLRGLTSAP